MAEKEHGYFRGTGGVVWRMDLPLNLLMSEQLAKQELVRVEAVWVPGNGEGEPGHYEATGMYSGPPTPVTGPPLPVDPRDDEIARLRARIAELETEPETDDDAEAHEAEAKVRADVAAVLTAAASKAPAKSGGGK